MPKLLNRPPKYSKFRQYAVVYHQSKRIYLGLYGSPESRFTYARLIAESQVNFIPHLRGYLEIGITVTL